MKTIDLRSDTITQPTDEMRKAMFEAEVGDDVFMEDPTIKQLEKRCAELSGKEGALFVPSGTMANLVCLLVHCNRGDEIILGDRSHIFLNEAGGVAAVGGIHSYVLKNQEDGTLLVDEIKAAVRRENVHFPISRLICLESTHNRCSGAVLPLEYMELVSQLAKKHGLSVHLDGARVFNAATALGCSIKDITSRVDSLTICLSKGLCAPVGSMVCGAEGFIKKARRARKLLGGGMRQAGVLAAAGLVGINCMTQRLEEDHENAKLLAKGVVKIPGLEISRELPQTNILYFDLKNKSAEEFAQALKERGLKVHPTGAHRIRMVTHYGITAEDINEALSILAETPIH